MSPALPGFAEQFNDEIVYNSGGEDFQCLTAGPAQMALCPARRKTSPSRGRIQGAPWLEFLPLISVSVAIRYVGAVWRAALRRDCPQNSLAAGESLPGVFWDWRTALLADESAGYAFQTC